jgi:hypothetical protein
MKKISGTTVAIMAHAFAGPAIAHPSSSETLRASFA